MAGGKLSDGISIVAAFTRVSQAVCIVVFGWAAYPKVLHVRDFAMDVLAYDLVGWPVARVVAIWLPWLEVAVALLLLLGIWTREAGWIAVTMTVVFTVAKISALVRGLEINCGCFGEGDPLTWMSVVWNIGLLAAAVLVTWRHAAAWTILKKNSLSSQEHTG